MSWLDAGGCGEEMFPKNQDVVLDGIRSSDRAPFGWDVSKRSLRGVGGVVVKRLRCAREEDVVHVLTDSAFRSSRCETSVKAPYNSIVCLYGDLYPRAALIGVLKRGELLI